MPRPQRLQPRPPLRSGFDRVGPFHPFVAFAAVLLVDLAGLALILFALAWTADRIEETFWPGGTDWVQFEL